MSGKKISLRKNLFLTVAGQQDSSRPWNAGGLRGIWRKK